MSASERSAVVAERASTCVSDSARLTPSKNVAANFQRQDLFVIPHIVSIYLFFFLNHSYVTVRIINECSNDLGEAPPRDDADSQ